MYPLFGYWHLSGDNIMLLSADLSFHLFGTTKFEYDVTKVKVRGTL